MRRLAGVARSLTEGVGLDIVDALDGSIDLRLRSRDPLSRAVPASMMTGGARVVIARSEVSRASDDAEPCRVMARAPGSLRWPMAEGEAAAIARRSR